MFCTKFLKLLLCLAIINLFFINCFPKIANAQTSSPNFDLSYSANEQGDIYIIGNSNLSCDIADSNCANARNGTGTVLRDNFFNMKNVDIDSDSSTFNSSSAKLNLKKGDSVLWAGLYWGGAHYSKSQKISAPNLNDRNKVLIKTPNSNNYSQIISANPITETTGTETTDYETYTDITDIVKNSGDGDYTIANVQVGTGSSFYGGWTLAVIVKNESDPLRNLSVFSGYTRILNSEPVTILLDGILTPKTGTVKTKIGLAVFDGDMQATGDIAKFNGKILSNKTNPANDFFNSSITIDGENVLDRNPAYINQLGLDIDVISSENLLNNNQTSTNLEFVTDGGDNENYNPYIAFIATDLHSPDLTILNTITNNITTAKDGDIIDYSSTIKNSGSDSAKNVEVLINLDPNLELIKESLKINGKSFTDLINDDQVDYDKNSGTLTFRLGDNANSSIGGIIPSGQTFVIDYSAKVIGSTKNLEIQAQSNAVFVADTLGISMNSASNIILTPVEAVIPSESPSPTNSPEPTPTEISAIVTTSSEPVNSAQLQNNTAVLSAETKQLNVIQAFVLPNTNLLGFSPLLAGIFSLIVGSLTLFFSRKFSERIRLRNITDK